MAWKKVGVVVYYDGRVVDTLTPRPVRVMPNGRAGVVYNGVVYPLYEGNIVLLEDEPVDKDECDRFVPAHAPIPYASDLDAGRGFKDEESGGHELRRGELTDRVMALSNRPLDAEDVKARIAAFEDDDDLGCGYLAWRYREVCTRPGYVVEDSVEGQLTAMATLVRDEKALLARLSSQHGPFLEIRPHLSERALNAELEKVETDASWRSPDDALRRCRASLAYVRHATVLAFGTEEGFSLLCPILEKLKPPAVVRIGDLPRNVAAAASNLTRMIDLVNELTGVDEPAHLCRRGREELLALQDGEFDCLADLPGTSEPHDRPLLGDLPFEVLPPGELLSSFVDELRRSGTYLGREVDRRRLDVLTDVARHFPSRESTMHRGAFTSSGRDNGYVVLRVALPGGAGEDAIAISPWKGEHATFVVRHGCGKQRPWPDVLSKTKREAKELGAHRLVFRVDLDYPITVYEAMVSRIVALLTCTPEEFDSGELYFDYGQGRYQVRNPYDYDGPLAGTAGRKSQSPNLIQRILNRF
jgi:hypothetical protein